MIICVKCKTIMVVEKNGVGADFGHSHIYAGDRYKCPKCDQMILYTNARPYLENPHHKHYSEYLKMEK